MTPGRGEPKIILVVDAQLELRELLTDFLRRLGFIAIPAPDAETASVVAEKLRIDLILLHLAVLDSKERAFLTQLKQKRPDAPIVVLSSSTDRVPGSECQDLGAAAIFHQPADLRDLKDAIFRLLDIPEPRSSRRSGRPTDSKAAQGDQPSG